MYDTNDTIAGIATPSGYGGVTIIKISGDRSISVLKALFRKNPLDLDPPLIEKKRQLMHGYVKNPRTLEVIDEVLVSFMPGPKSYTREDVIEINVHGGPVVSGIVFEWVIQQGTRVAEPGEFTQRAFLNGRIDLTQAEAVIDLINAKSVKGVTSLNRIAIGALGDKVREVIGSLEEMLVPIEASIDFGEEIGEIVSMSGYDLRVTDLLVRPLKKILDGYHYGRRVRDGLKVTILGAPNVGKSTLLNALVQSDKAIVTEIPGTTRDLIEDTFFIQGQPTIITDTAGLHMSDDPVEQIGIQKAIETSADADLILWVIDVGRPDTALRPEVGLSLDPKKTLLVLNKTDLDITTTIDSPFCSDVETVAISAKYGHGLSILKQRITRRIMAGHGSPETDDDISPNVRQKRLLENAIDVLMHTVEVSQMQLGIECIAEDLKAALGYLQKIIGEGVSTDVMDQIFNRFCIGK